MNHFEKNITNIYGDQGAVWLKNLPDIVDGLAKRYRLTDLTPVPNMTFNYVASGYQENQPIILKLGFDHQALAKEASCLACFADHGMPGVLASEGGMILMQKAIPGQTLKSYFPNRESDATQIFCDCLHKLHTAVIPAQHGFCTLNKLLETLNGDVDVPGNVLAQARRRRDQLLTTADKSVLLHGDLHHDNIISHKQDWWAIDPKAYVGDPVFETAAFICNPSPDLLTHANPMQVINQRIELISKNLGYTQQRIRDWLYVKSVLCWIWCLQDNCDVTYFRQFIHVIEQDPLFA